MPRAPMNLTRTDPELDPPEGKPGPWEAVGVCVHAGQRCSGDLAPAEDYSPRAREWAEGTPGPGGASAHLPRWACPAGPPFSAESRMVTTFD